MTAAGHGPLLIATVAASAALAGCLGGRTEAVARTMTGGDPQRGAQIVRAIGCGACHTIPSVDGAQGEVGPPLTGFARRTYIGGELANTPAHLIDWVVDPPAVEPRTAMPTLGLDRGQARDVAAFLYTLE